MISIVHVLVNLIFSFVPTVGISLENHKNPPSQVQMYLSRSSRGVRKCSWVVRIEHAGSIAHVSGTIKVIQIRFLKLAFLYFVT